jgi:hypothetical protein
VSGARVSSAEQGGLALLRIEADDMPAAHAALGAQLRAAIADVVERRLAATGAAELRAQLETMRQSRAHLERKAGAAALPAALRRALQSYLQALAAWAQGADLAALRPLAQRRGAACSADDLALWLQDDNTGCQTGVLRAGDGSVLLWHTEEDTIGYFDRPRLVEMQIGPARLGAFLYPYLLPGPAFGWCPRGLLAYDSLSVRRSAGGGTPTSTLSWILWSAQGELEPHATALALTPFLDGGAFTLVTRGERGVTAQVLEVGGELAVVAALADVPFAHRLQVNMVSEQAGALAALETLEEADRKPYRERLARSARQLEACAPEEAALQAMLASDEGGEWAFANADVVAHLVARVSQERLALQIGVGPARAGAGFAASFVLA